MLDSATNAGAYWGIDRIRDAFKTHHGGGAEPDERVPFSAGVQAAARRRRP